MDSRYQVMQYVAEVEGDRCSFRVFKTGDDRYYLFCQMDAHGCDTTLHFPVLRSDLHRAVRWSLLRGLSFSMPAYRRWRAAGGSVVPSTKRPREGES